MDANQMQSPQFIFLSYIFFCKAEVCWKKKKGNSHADFPACNSKFVSLKVRHLIYEKKTYREKWRSFILQKIKRYS